MRTVVAAAILDDEGRLLAARRTRPAALAGRWELPGGKVEPGEADLDALVRECREELGVDVTTGAQVGGDWRLSDDLRMRVWWARVARGDPRPLQDHDRLVWLDHGSWDSVEWLPGDVPVIQALRQVVRPVS